MYGYHIGSASAQDACAYRAVLYGMTDGLREQRVS